GVGAPASPQQRGRRGARLGGRPARGPRLDDVHDPAERSRLNAAGHAMRVGILGAGAMGAVHAAAWARLPDVEIAGIAGRTPGRATALAARFGARPFTNATTLLDDDTIDAVDITIPTASHRELVLAALARGKHVLCETPLASELADGDAMIAAARRSDALLQVALLSRVAQPGMQVREWLRAGVFGSPLVLSFERLWPGLAQLDDPEDHHGDALEEVSLFD